jgi:hypothetical protein
VLTLVRARLRSGTLHRVIVLAVLCAALALAGCKSINEPIMVKTDKPVSAGTVQATMTTAPAPRGAWPAKVGEFAANYKKRVWYPTAVPKSFEAPSVDVIELDPGTGLVCDMAFTHDSDAIIFTQGSAKARAYDIVSLGKVAWGDQKADIVREDPDDPSTRKMIVLSNADGLSELSGSVDFNVLKEVAASMKPVE